MSVLESEVSDHLREVTSVISRNICTNEWLQVHMMSTLLCNILDSAENNVPAIWKSRKPLVLIFLGAVI